MRTRTWLIAGLFTSLSIFGQVQSPPHFKLTDLGLLPGTAASRATAISDSGIVVGFSGKGVTPENNVNSGIVVGTSTGFFYSQGVMTPIDGSTAVAGSPAALMIPRGVTSSGDFAGVAQIADQPQPRRVIFQGGKFDNLDLPLALYLYGMNDAGQVVGGGDLTHGIVSPFIWQAGKVTVLPSKNKAALATSISPNGIAAGSEAGDDYFRPVIWANGQEQYIPLPTGFDNGFIYSVNNSGQAVGVVYLLGGPGFTLLNGRSVTMTPPASAAFFSNGQTTVLPSLPGAVATFATSINDAGWIAGYGINVAHDFFQIEFDLDFGMMAPATADRHAAFWMNGNVYDLTSLVVSNGSGWQLTSVFGMNSSGQIVGSGLIGGKEHAFLLTPVGIGSLAQIASAGGWDTSLTLVNLGTTVVSPSLNFFSDPGGAPLNLPFTFPQGSAAATTASTISQSMNPGALLVVDTTGPLKNTANVGWSQLSAPTDVNGYAIFTNTTANWQAAVPLETRNASSYLLAFDNTGQLATGLAIANLSSQPANVNVTIRNDAGTQIGTETIALAALGHTSFMLNGQYAITAGLRGTVEFDTPTGGQISVLGLRANGPALTTVPVLANVAPGTGSISHVTFNGGWQTTITLVNTGTSPAQPTLSFFNEQGGAMTVPLAFPQTGTKSSSTTLTPMLGPGQSLIMQTQGQDNLTSISGSALLTSTGNVSGFAIFRNDASGQEAVVPLETRNAGKYVLGYDNTNERVTGLAIANASSTLANLTLTVRDDTAAVLQTIPVMLAGHGHMSAVLPTTYPSSAGKRGTVEIDGPAGFSALGLFVTPTGNVTTLPVLVK